MRKEKIRLPKKDIYRWFYNSFGIGGLINYYEEDQKEILKAIKILLDKCGSIELEFIGKVLIKLSERPFIQEEFLEELENLGF